MLRTDDRDSVRWLILDRPERKNAIPAGEWEALAEVFSDFERSAQRVLVVTGAGGDFCTGADLSEVEADLGNATDRLAMMERVHDAALALHRTTKPTIAAVDGYAVGAGANLALGCDLAIGTTRMRFSEIFVRRGLTVDFGGTWLLPRRVGIQRAKELAFTGRVVEAEEALALGLVLELVEPDRLADRAGELAAELGAAAPVALAFTKRALDRSLHSSMEEMLDGESAAQAQCFTTTDMREGVSAFLEKRPPRFTGA